jgi:uncharacterized protein YuzB (UPF0349 family)
MPDIEYCLNNVDSDTRTLLRGTDARETTCLGRCGRCYSDPFLLVDGEVRTGDHCALVETAGADR